MLLRLPTPFTCDLPYIIYTITITELLSAGQVFWKCYEYGDDLVQIFEFIDDQRAKSVREIQIPDPETAEEFIDKHGSIVRSVSMIHLQSCPW